MNWCASTRFGIQSWSPHCCRCRLCRGGVCRFAAGIAGRLQRVECPAHCLWWVSKAYSCGRSFGFLEPSRSGMGLAIGTVASWSSCFGIVPEATALVEDQGRGLVPVVWSTHLKPFLPGSCRPLVLCTKPASDGTSPEGSDIWNWVMTGRYFHLHLTERGKSPNYLELGLIQVCFIL